MAVTRTWSPKLGLDLQGGQTITLSATNRSVPMDSLELARDIIQQRVDGLGVGEASVAIQGDRNIVVSAPNVDRDDLAELVGATAQLAFRPVLDVAAGTGPTATPSPGETPVPGLPTAPASPTPTPSPAATPTGGADGQAGDEPLLSMADVLAYQPTAADTQALADFTCGDPTHDDADRALVACDDQDVYKYLLGPIAIRGQDLNTASFGIPQGDLAYAVTLSFNSEGATRLSDLTGTLVSQTQPRNMFAIVLDGVVESAARAEAKIANGEAIIRGDFNADSAAGLANVLKFGSLPLSFEPSQVETVSPTLGGEQLRVGIIAGILGLAVVALYSFLYYRAMGIVVVASLAVAAAATYAMMVLLGSVFGFALNLPGIAGAIVGIAVTADSFIIYFERIRDEIREGKSLKSALQSGWEKARGTIVISDAVSLLSAVVLFILAIGSVKGFAFTLGLTTLLDLAVVFFFTRPLVELLGRTKFFGEGRRGSGLDAAHMGVTQESLLGRRLRRKDSTSTIAQEA
ncbi:protein-export membrane protein SecD [Tessaracoccus aquimaris]|uniref:Protein translocase subunit SecD n=1 Tax=Tessaracoccus aquimaris TaxID=1332264 RepID=A0A1Q2CSZ9_9ACTN|nr:protein translocase subunit SecD [Tessaracoccus aquimaris]AQP49238.1 protein-export membrane protein SecD [Tessaracoccus aquimaris]